MTADQPPVLSEPSYLACLLACITSQDVTTVHQSQDRLRAHDSALRSKLAERDRLLEHAMIYLHRSHKDSKCSDCASIRAALEGGPR